MSCSCQILDPDDPSSTRRLLSLRPPLLSNSSKPEPRPKALNQPVPERLSRYSATISAHSTQFSKPAVFGTSDLSTNRWNLHEYSDDTIYMSRVTLNSKIVIFAPFLSSPATLPPLIFFPVLSPLLPIPTDPCPPLFSVFLGSSSSGYYSCYSSLSSSPPRAP